MVFVHDALLVILVKIGWERSGCSLIVVRYPEFVKEANLIPLIAPLKILHEYAAHRRSSCSLFLYVGEHRVYKISKPIRLRRMGLGHLITSGSAKSLIAQSPANLSFLKSIFVLPTVSVDNCVDKTGDERPKVMPCKDFSCAACFLSYKIIKLNN
jgi:hypothetical protein